MPTLLLLDGEVQQKRVITDEELLKLQKDYYWEGGPSITKIVDDFLSKKIGYKELREAVAGLNK